MAEYFPSNDAARIRRIRKKLSDLCSRPTKVSLMLCRELFFFALVFFLLHRRRREKFSFVLGPGSFIFQICAMLKISEINRDAFERTMFNETFFLVCFQGAEKSRESAPAILANWASKSPDQRLLRQIGKGLNSAK